MTRRLIVTGCGGFVAGSIVSQAGPEWDVHALTRGEPLLKRDGLTWHRVDLCDSASLWTIFRRIRPDVVIHAAAIADIDYCENHPDIAELVNVDVTRSLVLFSRQVGARMVYISTDTVFDGKSGMYREEDPPRPVNVYAETKLRAENIVLGELEAAVVARLSLVVGMPILGSGNSFLARMLPALREGREVSVPAREMRTPIDVITVGRALLELAEGSYAGYIHLAGNDRLSRCSMVRRIAARLGCPETLVMPRESESLPGRAPRPHDVSLDNARARATLRTPMLGLDDALELILQAGKGV